MGFVVRPIVPLVTPAGKLAGAFAPSQLLRLRKHARKPLLWVKLCYRYDKVKGNGRR
jgi:hypothetical protein